MTEFNDLIDSTVHVSGKCNAFGCPFDNHCKSDVSAALKEPITPLSALNIFKDFMVCRMIGSIMWVPGMIQRFRQAEAISAEDRTNEIK